MNLVLCPDFVFMGIVERVPGAKKVECVGCGVALTATPTSLDAAGVDGGFLCKNCGERVMVRGIPVRRPDGAADELRAAGLGSIADDDEQLMRKINGRLGAN